MSEKVVRRRLADGSVKEYRYDRRKPRILPGSLGAIIQEYRQSPGFTKLAPNTKKTYLRAMAHMADLYRVAVADIRRRHIVKLRDRHQSVPAIANQIVAVFSVLMKHAIEMEYRETNPARGIPFFAATPYRRWTDEQIEYALEAFPERYARAIILALYTGQRQGDVLKMRWSDYDGEFIQVVQQKTGKKLWIPCADELKPHLETWKAEDRTALTIITDSRGRPYRADSFATNFGAEMKKHVELRGLVFHGLRKTAAAILAELGCPPLDIAAVTGHQTLNMILHYTEEADQKVRARAAIRRLNARKTPADKRKENEA